MIAVVYFWHLVTSVTDHCKTKDMEQNIQQDISDVAGDTTSLGPVPTSAESRKDCKHMPSHLQESCSGEASVTGCSEEIACSTSSQNLYQGDSDLSACMCVQSFHKVVKSDDDNSFSPNPYQEDSDLSASMYVQSFHKVVESDNDSSFSPNPYQRDSDLSACMCVQSFHKAKSSDDSLFSPNQGDSDLSACICVQPFFKAVESDDDSLCSNTYSQHAYAMVYSDAESACDHTYTCSRTVGETEAGKLKNHAYTCSRSVGETEVGKLKNRTCTCSQTKETSDSETVLTDPEDSFLLEEKEESNQNSAADNLPVNPSAMSEYGDQGKAESAEAKDRQETRSHEDEERRTGGPTFNPPVYSQRYTLVQKVLEEHGVESVVDFGSAECKIIHFFKNVKTLQRICLVDVDKSVLRTGRRVVKPDIFEFLFPRLTPLTVSLYCGSAGKLDSRVTGCHAASLVEIIEHLDPSVLEQVMNNVFGRLRPSVVIVTTPNADFNVVFPNFTGFRHWDHKFEWTREEFQQWCGKVCQQHGYTVRYTGVGNPPPEMSHVGFCSQAAIFTETSGKAGDQTDEEVYELVQEEVYPHDKRTSAERLANEVDYMISSFHLEESYMSEDNTKAIIPVTYVTRCLLQRQKKDNWTEGEILTYLQGNYTLTDDDASIVVQLEDEEKSSESDDNDVDVGYLDGVEESTQCQQAEQLSEEDWE